MERKNNNTWNLLKLCFGLSLIFSLSACGVEEDRYGYGDWDADENEMVDRNEFNSSIADRYNEYDGNDDGFLDENEFTEFNDNREYYSNWDADGDSRLNENEFHDGLFSEWDGNEDAYLDENEYNENHNTFFGS